MMNDSRMLKIGIFYDGNYFYHVSNYYCYAHPKRSRLSISGLHDFIRHYAGKVESVDTRFCQIVDCHYFRGRLPALEANARQILLNERMFDDILMREGVVTHYLPVVRGGEKGVDVSLALEVLELTIFKKFDIVVLIASDGDYVPLVRKLNSLGTRVMVLGWDFEYQDDNGNQRYTATSGKMMNEVTYPIWMHKIIDGQDSKFDSDIIDSMFVPSSSSSREDRLSVSSGQDGVSSSQDYGSESDYRSTPEISRPVENVVPGERIPGRVIQLKNGYGFIASETMQKNLFFFWEDLDGVDFNELSVGDTVDFEIGMNERGECARHVSKIHQPEE